MGSLANTRFVAWAVGDAWTFSPPETYSCGDQIGDVGIFGAVVLLQRCVHGTVESPISYARKIHCVRVCASLC